MTLIKIPGTNYYFNSANHEPYTDRGAILFQLIVHPFEYTSANPWHKEMHELELAGLARRFGDQWEATDKGLEAMKIIIVKAKMLRLPWADDKLFNQILNMEKPNVSKGFDGIPTYTVLRRKKGRR